MKMGKFEIISLAASAVAFIAGIAGNWASERKQEKEIDEKLDEKLEKLFGKSAAE